MLLAVLSCPDMILMSHCTVCVPGVLAGSGKSGEKACKALVWSGMVKNTKGRGYSMSRFDTQYFEFGHGTKKT